MKRYMFDAVRDAQAPASGLQHRRAQGRANEEQRRSSLDLIAKEVPAGDKVHLASNAEYDKIDGFHHKPIGADAIL